MSAPSRRDPGCLNGLRYLNWDADRGHLHRGAALAKESPPPDSKWLVYVASLPMDDPAARMRVLRTLESMGCAVLREGVYLRSEEHTSELQSLAYLVCRLLLEKKKKIEL